MDIVVVVLSWVVSLAELVIVIVVKSGGVSVVELSVVVVKVSVPMHSFVNAFQFNSVFFFNASIISYLLLVFDRGADPMS